MWRRAGRWHVVLECSDGRERHFISSSAAKADTGKPERTSLGAALRFEILQRDNFTCRYCGRSSPDVELHVDHVHPVSKGGTDDPQNLVAACVDCNLGKNDRTAA